ncbi:hypothetical protein BDA96_03G146100 [Sorghum bicolor]|uniref:Uncharacterized protein n=2 Tax=Sorghum bicolor TaxID=4558 RepID=A0A921RBI0_SORBI|nr:hypothetical protein BDA96_03G146100 [Sorghum bicolor]OQU86751.1 hypothetical protein SORBI_3003G139333 [Sorghum bicolor]
MVGVMSGAGSVAQLNKVVVGGFLTRCTSSILPAVTTMTDLENLGAVSTPPHGATAPAPWMASRGG